MDRKKSILSINGYFEELIIITMVVTQFSNLTILWLFKVFHAKFSVFHTCKKKKKNRQKNITFFIIPKHLYLGHDNTAQYKIVHSFSVNLDTTNNRPKADTNDVNSIGFVSVPKTDVYVFSIRIAKNAFSVLRCDVFTKDSTRYYL